MASCRRGDHAKDNGKPALQKKDDDSAEAEEGIRPEDDKTVADHVMEAIRVNYYAEGISRNDVASFLVGREVLQPRTARGLVEIAIQFLVKKERILRLPNGNVKLMCSKCKQPLKRSGQC